MIVIMYNYEGGEIEGVYSFIGIEDDFLYFL